MSAPLSARLPVRRLFATAATALRGGLLLAAPLAERVAAQPGPAGVSTLSSGRVWSLVAALLGLAGVVAGGLALARPAGRAGTGTGRRGAVAALVAGAAGVVAGGLVVAAAEGGPGTGYGIVGGYVALVVGLAAMALGGLALARSRRFRRTG